MVQLIAHAPEDGWAFVREGDRILLLRPPYRGNHLAVRPEDVERAVTVHGYLACNRHFSTERDLIQHLRDEVVRSWPAKEAPETLRDDLLRLADPDEIDVYLDEADAWMGEGRVSQVIVLLAHLLKATELTYKHRCRIASVYEAARSQRDARKKLKDDKHRAQMPSKFQRAHAHHAGGASARGGRDDEEPGVFCPASRED
jgi:hypothetical protein